MNSYGSFIEQHRLKQQAAKDQGFERITLGDGAFMTYEFFLCQRKNCGNVVWDMEAHRNGCP